jgi:DNA-binding CsgD family transcriptional regulator
MRRMPAAGQPSSDLLELIAETHELLDLAAFRERLLAAIGRAVGCEWVSLNEIASDGAPIAVHTNKPIDDWAIAAFAGVVHENPLIRHYAETRDARTLRISDVCSRAAFQKTGFYREFFALLGLEHQMAFTLPTDYGRILGVAISRGEPDFSDRERDLIESARAFLIQAYRNSLLLSAARDDPDALDGARGLSPARLLELGLSLRQAQVLRLVAAGASDAAVAEQLGLSPRTVQKHLQLAYRTLGARNRTDAVRIAREAS